MDTTFKKKSSFISVVVTTTYLVSGGATWVKAADSDGQDAAQLTVAQQSNSAAAASEQASSASPKEHVRHMRARKMHSAQSTVVENKEKAKSGAKSPKGAIQRTKKDPTQVSKPKSGMSKKTNMH